MLLVLVLLVLLVLLLVLEGRVRLRTGKMLRGLLALWDGFWRSSRSGGIAVERFVVHEFLEFLVLSITTERPATRTLQFLCLVSVS